VRIKLGPAVAGTLLVASTAVVAGNVRWSRATTRAVSRVSRASGEGVERRYSPSELTGLPAPVARYFDFALTPGQRLVRRALVKQRGEFALQPGEWRRMRATGTFWVGPPAFVWDASIGVLPGIDVRVRDGYFGGSASMKASIAGLVSVVDQADTPGLPEGALVRYLAEAPLVPTALLPSAGVVWTAVDDSTARATISDAGITVTVTVQFAASGEIIRIAADRYRDVNGVGVLTPFRGSWSGYRRVDGMMVPSAGEAGWILPEGAHDFWRAEITAFEFS
jgi:hypothetical protein